MPLWGIPLGLGLLYLFSQGYIVCGKSVDPHWGSRAAQFVAQRPAAGQAPFSAWGRAGEADVLRASVSRLANANAHLTGVFVVRDKPIVYFTGSRFHPAPLYRSRLEGYPLFFCGHARINGRLNRFSYMPQQQELILLPVKPRTQAEYAALTSRKAARERRLEKEFQRICGRSLEGSANHL